MRTISDTLLAAQQAGNTPYIRLVFTSPDGLTEYNYSTNEGRLRQIEHHEEAYNDYATIILRNEDGGIASDLTGYWVQIGYGHETSEGVYESSSTSRLWVKSQMELSAEGQKYTILDCGGMWDMLREVLVREGNPPYYMKYEDPETGETTYHPGLTVFWLLDAVIKEVGIEGYDYYDFVLLDYEDQDDGIIDTFVPKFNVNAYGDFEDALALIRRLIEMTKCYIRLSAGLYLKIIYPQESDSVDAIFYSDQAHYFFEYLEKLNLIIPNHIIVFANAGDDGEWTNIITAEASDADQIARYRDVVEIHTAELIDNQGDADNRAEAILCRRQAELLSARLIIPHHCGLELYDRVKIHDAR
jgi:hypothetical protein